jgi:hypothetical protein
MIKGVKWKYWVNCRSERLNIGVGDFLFFKFLISHNSISHKIILPSNNFYVPPVFNNFF